MTMTTMQAQTHTMPRANGRDGVAPIKGNPAQLLHLVLFVAGAVLLPGGLIVIGLGWYGVSHTPYTYDQTSYLVSGGILGLGITFVGGFLYFGSWLARIAADQKEASNKLSDTLLLLADAVSHNTAMAGTVADTAVVTAPLASTQVVSQTVTRPVATPARNRDAGAVLVVAGRGKTVHRADCDLIAGREDLKPAGSDVADLIPCRLCQS
jgi:hypothetical protein